VEAPRLEGNKCLMHERLYLAFSQPLRSDL
jgi:hypothetical protein